MKIPKLTPYGECLDPKRFIIIDKRSSDNPDRLRPLNREMFIIGESLTYWDEQDEGLFIKWSENECNHEHTFTWEDMDKGLIEVYCIEYVDTSNTEEFLKEG
jgi:hypothetical protein